MCKWLVILLGSALLGLAQNPQVQRPLPNILIASPDGKKIDLKLYHGKVVVLVLFSTQCDDCLRTLGIVARFQKELGARGFQAVAAAINDDAPAETGPYVERYRPGFPIGYLDRDSAVKMAAIPPGKRPFVPILIFIDRRSTVRFEFYADDPAAKDPEKLIRSLGTGLLNEDPNKPPKTITKQAAAPH